MRYPQYKEYKNTGHRHIGEVPSHWGVRKLKFMAGIQNGRDYKHVESDVGFDVIGSGGAFVKASEYLYDGESVLFGRKGTIDIPLYINAKFWTVDTMFYSEINNNTVAKYLYYYATTIPYKYLATQTALPSITQSDLENYFLAFPHRKEQQKIANFLDYKTQQIDQLIEKKKALIEKLGEQRIAVITQAVTKGLDKNAKMKPSGVDWLGDVPEHWEVKAIKRICMVSRGASPRPIQDPRYFDEEGEYAWVRIADVTANGHYLKSTTQRLSEMGMSFSVPLEPGSLFLSIAGSVGKPMITEIKCCIHDGFVYFPHLTSNPEFLYYIFLGGQCYLGLGKLGTQLNLNTDTVGAIKIGVPSEEEQEEIIKFLHTDMRRIDLMAEKVNSAIELLKEYRSAIITAAVTGKIDIRNIDLENKEVA